jgi:O-antigen ligase
VGLRYALLIFFLGMMVMLSSRLLMVMTPFILFDIISRKFSRRKRKLALLVAAALVLAAAGIFGSSKNFISWRFGEIKEGQIAVLKQKQFDPNTHFSSWDSRLLQWRYAVEILNEGHGWLFGVSPGDSQNLLDAKYINAHMYIGDPAEGPNRHNRGYLGFNFHDQYIETFVRTGIVGLASLIAIFVLFFRGAGRSRLREAWYIMLTITLFFVVESPITLQHGVFLFCFFPLLVLNAPKSRERGPAKVNIPS